MKIKGIEIATLQTIAADMGFKLENHRRVGRFECFVLRMATHTPKGEDKGQYRKHGFSRRWTCAVCFHGHKRFFERLFAHNPGALIVTTKRRWTSLEDLRVNAEMVGMQNVGSMFNPMQYREQCDCYGG